MLAILFLVAAQAAPSAPNSAKFEVASIKPCAQTPPNGGGAYESPGRLRFVCASLEDLIRGAHIRWAGSGPMRVDEKTGASSVAVLRGLLRQPIAGLPTWARTERFAVDAKADGPAGTELMRGPMMRALLKDRFRLAVHKVTTQLPVYQLQHAKAKELRPWKEGDCMVLHLENGPPPPRAPGQGRPLPVCGAFSLSEKGGLDVFGVTMAQFCSLLSGHLDRDLIDKTGIAGRFDLHLDMTFAELRQTAPAQVDSDPGGSLPGALSRLGLKMVAAKETVETIAVDRVERSSGN